jgi:hypothetical protein
MFFIIAWLVAVGIAITFGVGYLIARLDTPPYVQSPVSNDSGIDCATLCFLFNIRRAELCVAQADERRAQVRLDSLSAQRDAALKVWAIATAAALAAMFIPIIGPIISGGFAVTAGIALTAVVGFNGAIFWASDDLSRRATYVLGCVSQVSEARRLLLEKCPEQASSCLATPSPC